MSDVAADARPQPVLMLRGLDRNYPSGDKILHVLRGVDLDVRPGEIVGLIGPSGSGKSSLLHAAGLLEKPTAGRIFVKGVEATGMADAARTKLRRQAIGFVYQFHHLLPEFSALDNVALPLRIDGEGVRSSQDRARLLLTGLGLGERLNHQPAQMSGGEQQRTAIARALANRPRLLLADEPTGNLDPATSAAVFDSLFRLVREEGVAALIATHNLELASFMDRVLTLQDGRLVEQPRTGSARAGFGGSQP